MKYQLIIRDENIEPHLDIENEIKTLKNGSYDFVIQYDKGMICAYNVYERIDPENYIVGTLTVEEYLVTHDH